MYFTIDLEVSLNQLCISSVWDTSTSIEKYEKHKNRNMKLQWLFFRNFSLE